MDAAGVERAVLIGHSLGATIAIDMALARPGRVAGVVVLGPAISGRPTAGMPTGLDSMIAALRRRDLVAAGHWLGRAPVMTLMRDSSRQEWVRGLVADNVRLLAGDPRRITPMGAPAFGRMAELRIPLLVILGQADPTESNAAGRDLLRGVAGAVADSIPRCGHLLPIDCPLEVGRSIRQFLDAARVQRPHP
jgi:pimeloyl-ACP methyl ester carboxylesterase